MWLWRTTQQETVIYTVYTELEVAGYALSEVVLYRGTVTRVMSQNCDKLANQRNTARVVVCMNLGRRCSKLNERLIGSLTMLV